MDFCYRIEVERDGGSVTVIPALTLPEALKFAGASLVDGGKVTITAEEYASPPGIHLLSHGETAALRKRVEKAE